MITYIHKINSVTAYNINLPVADI